MRPEVTLKTDYEIRLMRESGALLADVFAMLDERVKPGITTLELDTITEHFIRHELKATPASIGAYGYPFSTNASPNHVACHGMPSKDTVIASTDILNIDITLEKNGFIVDSNKTYVLPDASSEAQHLVTVANQAMWKGIEQVFPGAHSGDIGFAISEFVESLGYSVVREFCGHGIGRMMHEAPQILHFGLPKTGFIIEPGMTFTVEPVVNQGSNRVITLKDGWTVVTCDNRLSAQFEHTLAVTKEGVEILTLRHDETPFPWRK